jgi:hypothetical protein
LSDKEAHVEIITVIAKTYPECSGKYGCLVCTAGINEDGEWRRIYPVPWYMFRREGIEKGLNFKKWDKIKVSVKKAHPDHRPESYKVLNPEGIEVVGSLKDQNERRWFLEKFLDKNMESLWEQKRSLGVIKPKKLVDFVEKERNKISDQGEKDLLDKSIQTLLPEFAPKQVLSGKVRPREIPWIGYHFDCMNEKCNGHQMMCIDWEIQELYRREGLEKTKPKALDWMRERDLYFAVGTTWRYPTWMVISLTYPTKMLEQPLVATLGRDAESLSERKGDVSGQLTFGEDGLEGQTSID